MNRFRTLLSVLILTVLTAPISAFPQSDPASNSASQYASACGAFARNMAKVKLTAAQKPQVALLLAAYSQDLREISPSIVNAGKDLFTAVHTYSDPFNEQAVKDAQQNFSALDQTRVVLKAKFFHDIHAIVTQAQYDRLVAADAQLFICAHAPYRTFRAYLKNWVGNNLPN